MPENDRLDGCLEEINVEFIEREATSRLLMKLSIQLHLAGLSLSNTVSFLENDVFLRSQTVSVTPKQKLPTTGSDHSASHGISLSEHYLLTAVYLYLLAVAVVYLVEKGRDSFK